MRRRAAAAAVVAALTAAGAPAAAAPSVASGPLRVEVTQNPWRLTFHQRGGQSLREAPGAPRGGPAGTLGFHTAAGWSHATRLLSWRRERGGVVARVATDDLAGRVLEVRLRPAGGGAVALRASVPGPLKAGVDAMGIGFDAPRSERFYGLGERSTAVDQRGQDVENYVSDGPFTRDTRPFVAASIPPQGYRQRDDATYYPVPWMLSSRGYGLLLGNHETSTFHLASDPDDVWSVEAAAAELRLEVFAGPTPAGALRRFTRATGRQPPPAAAWQYGPWFQTGQPNIVPLADEAAWLAKLRAADAPVSAAETQLRYLPCGLDRGNEDYEARRVRFFHRHGLAILTYVNPMVCRSYEPLFSRAAAAGALQRNAAGEPYTFNSFVGGTGPAGFTIQPVAEFDFSSPAGIRVYSSVLRRMLAAGHDGWMEDFGEYTPADTRPRDRTAPEEMHNRYPATYHCAVKRLLDRGFAPRPVVRFQRSGWTRAARCASDVWGGDPTTQFGYDGLSSAVIQALGIGMSGVSRWGSDIGGYDTLGNDPRLTPELLKRWIELGAVSGVMRTKSSGIAIPPYERPQIWEPGIVGVWRRYAKLHTQLHPYLRAADAEYRATGLPMMRALVLTHPRDRRAQAVDDEFELGDALLAAPVVTEGARRRSVYLPRGRWMPWWRAVRFARRSGGFHVKGGSAVRGGRTVTAPAPLDELPLFVRAGAIVPMLTADVSTLAPYRGGAVRLKDRAGRLRLLAFPRGRSTGRAYVRDRFRSRAKHGTWRLAIRAARTRRFQLEAATAGIEPSHGRRFTPCAVELDGRALPSRRWRFDRRRRVLRVRFRLRTGVLTVRDRCA